MTFKKFKMIFRLFSNPSTFDTRKLWESLLESLYIVVFFFLVFLFFFFTFVIGLPGFCMGDRFSVLLIWPVSNEVVCECFNLVLLNPGK